MASRIQRELALLLTGKDISASKAVRGVNSALKDLNKTGRNAGAAVAKNIERGAMIGAAAATAAIGFAINKAMSFEAQLRTINTIAREDAAGLAVIGNTIRKESRESGTAVEDLTAAYYDLLSAGIKTADAQGVLHTANTLAIGGLSTTAEAVDLLTTAINTYGGDASKGAQFADEFAKSIERGKVTAADLAAVYSTVGPLAASLGVENAELAAGFARLTAGGTSAGEAATQMASALTGLIKKSVGLKKLEKQTKRNYAAIAERDGLGAAYAQLSKDADKAGVALVDLLGRKEALLYALQVTGPNQEAYNADLAAMGDSAGTAAEQMGERNQGLAFQIKRLRANVNDAAITIGTKMLPILADLAEDATGWLMTHQDEIADFGQDLADGLRDAVKWAKSLDWEAIGAGLSIAAGAGKALIEAFTAAPPWLQGFLATGFLANKFTGGAVMDVAGILLGQVVKGVLGMNAGVVNINAGIVNGGGAPLPGGGKFGFLGSALKVTVIGAVAIAGFETAADLVGFNEPRHQTNKPPGKFNSTTFRGTNVASEQIANLERGLPGLIQRAMGGDTFAARQLETVRAEIARLRDTIRSGPVVGQPGPTANDREGRNRPVVLSGPDLAAANARQAKTDALLSDIGLLTQRAGERTAGAVSAMKPPVFNAETTVNVNLTAASVGKTVVVANRMGKQNGSYGGGRGRPGAGR